MPRSHSYSAAPKLNALAPPASCRQAGDFRATLTQLSASFSGLQSQATAISSQLKTAQETIKDQGETLADDVLEVRVAEAKAVSNSASYLTTDAAAAVDAATEAVSSTVQQVKPLLSLESADAGLIQSYRSLLQSLQCS